MFKKLFKLLFNPEQSSYTPSTSNKHQCYYRTSDNEADYAFSFEKQSDGTWRIYIENQPSYGNHDTGAHPTHRFSDGSRKYICWEGNIMSLNEAKKVAKLWADKTQEYIKYGRRF